MFMNTPFPRALFCLLSLLLLQGRLFSYNDTHRHRLGANYQQIPVNRAFNAKVQPYQRDGAIDARPVSCDVTTVFVVVFCNNRQYFFFPV